MIFNVFRRNDGVQKEEKRTTKKTIRHVEREKKEQERRAKKAKRQAEKVELERKEREKKFCTLDELLKGAPFNSRQSTAVAYRMVMMDEAIGWEERHPTAFIEIVMASGERHFLHNRVRASTKNKISESHEKNHFHFIPIPVREAEAALECVLPKFSPIGINCVTSNTQNSPLDATEKTALAVSPEQVNPSGSVLDYGLTVAELWLTQKNKLCSNLEISNKTYDICRKRFELQAEAFSRKIEKEAGNSDDKETESSKNPSVLDKKSRASDSSSPSNQLHPTAEWHEPKAINIDQNQENNRNNAKNDVEITPTEKELLIFLRMLRQIEPIKFHWDEILSFRVIYILSGNQRYPTIQLISKGGHHDDLIYHELPEAIANYIIDLKPYGEAVSFSKYYVPLDISLAEKALGKVIPELHSRKVYAKTYNDFVSFKKQQGIPGVKEPLELFPPEKLLTIEGELSDWFMEVQNMWNSSRAMQLSRISLSDYNHIMAKYQEYETVKGVLVHQTEQKRKDAEEEARVKQDAQIQRAGDEGEKRVKYVLDCIGSDTIQVGSNTVNKYNKPCIMLMSEKWAKIPQEFDHIIIRENGVFLIETKNLSGTIEIDSSGNWAQTKRNQPKIAIESPAFQTYRHEKLVCSFLAPEIPVSSIICLANPHTLVKGQENCNVPVLKWDLLAQYIEEWKSKKKLSREEMDAVHEQIKEHYYECAADKNTGISND